MTRKKELIGIVLSLVVVLLLAHFITPYVAAPQDNAYYEADHTTVYYRAKVVATAGNSTTVRLEDGPDKGQERQINNSTFAGDTRTAIGATVLVADNNHKLQVASAWRIPGLLILVGVFFIAVVIIGRRRGAASIIGLLVSVIIIGAFVIPQILQGANAFLILITAAVLIAIVSIYTAHGINRQTTISVIVIAAVLAIVTLLSAIGVWGLALTGRVDETAVNLTASLPGLDLQGLLAGTIIIATLGVLDDTVTTQVATVAQLIHANKKLSTVELFRRASIVGREHIAALVNTIALVYIGIAFPTVLMLASSQAYSSPLLLINSEFVVQEVVRTLVSSLGLLLAVPVSTLLAAILLKRWQHSSTRAQG